MAERRVVRDFSLLRSSLDLSNNVDVSFMKRQAFRDHKILIVNLDDPQIGWDERQMLLNIGNRLYGKGKSAGG